MGDVSKGAKEPSKEEVAARVAARISKGEIPVKKQTQIFRLIRESGAWRVFVDFGAEDRAKKEYFSKIQIFDLKAETRDVFGEKVAAVEFKLRNSGDRALKRVSVGVELADADGKKIHDEKFEPVRPAEGKPLAAGAVWEIEAGSYFAIKPIPAGWKEGAITAAIADFELAPAPSE